MKNHITRVAGGDDAWKGHATDGTWSGLWFVSIIGCERKGGVGFLG